MSRELMMVNGAECLPVGWAWTTVQEVGLVASGQTPKGLENLSGDGEIPFYKVSDMNRAGNETQMHDSAIYLSNRDVKQLKLRMFDAGTVIFPKRGGAIATNKKRILSKPSAFDLNIMGVIPKKITPKYFYYWLSSIDLATLSDGSNVPQINHKDIVHLPFPLAPLPEQERIVARIEELFTQLEAGTTALEKVQAGLRRYKASVLKAAVEGKLLENRELENSGELPEGWKWTTVGELAEKAPYSITDGPFGSKLKTAHYTEHGPRVIRLQNIGDGEFRNEKAHISQEHFETLQRHRIYGGDLVIAGLGESLPRACIIPDYVGDAIVKADCIRFKPNPKIADTRYLLFALNSEPVKKLVAKVVHGIGRPRMNQQEIKAISIPLPLLEEQRRIVAEVERRLSVARQVENAVELALARASRLRQAVLKSAFEGRF